METTEETITYGRTFLTVTRVKGIQLREIKAGGAVACHISEAGAMGRGGYAVWLTHDGQWFETDWYHGDMTTDELKNLVWGLRDSRITAFGITFGFRSPWQVLNMGYGNFLLVKPEMFKKMFRRTGTYTPESVYCFWTDMAESALEKVRKDEEKAEETLKNMDFDLSAEDLHFDDFEDEEKKPEAKAAPDE